MGEWGLDSGGGSFQAWGDQMMRFFLLLMGVCFIGVCSVSSAIAQVATIPEIEGPRAKYQEALAKIRVERDLQAADANRTYAARLQDLHKQLTGEGEALAAAAVQLEIDRGLKGVEPTNEERRKMTGLLLALRVAYEKARGPAYMKAAKEEGDAHAAWEAGLAQLEAYLTRMGQTAKVAVAKAERARIEQAKIAAKEAAARAAAAFRPAVGAGVTKRELPPLVANDSGLVDQMQALADGRSGSPIKLKKDEKLATAKTFKPPVDILIEAMTDSTNLRLSYAANQVIFNWEMGRKQLRVDGGPAGGKHKPGAGLIPTNQVVSVRWLVTPKRQAIFVDGELRYEHEGDYSNLDQPIRVFPAQGSEVTVRSIKVKELPAGTE
jgi:hypothetical protein